MRTRLFVVLSALTASTFALAGCAVVPPAPEPHPTSTTCDGVRVVVNFGLLSNADSRADISTCAPASGANQTVADALAAVNITTEGTAKYGDQVVCRVNGVPAADQAFTIPGHDPYTETCATMAPDYAYWALWLRHGTGAWDYATAGVSTQKVVAGDSIGIVFTTGGATPTPSN